MDIETGPKLSIHKRQTYTVTPQLRFIYYTYVVDNVLQYQAIIKYKTFQWVSREGLNRSHDC